MGKSAKTAAAAGAAMVKGEKTQVATVPYARLCPDPMSYLESTTKATHDACLGIP